MASISPYQLKATYSDLTRESIKRHRESDHIPTKLLKAQDAEDISDADRIAAELEAVKADVRRLAEKAEERDDLRTALAGCDKALKALELQAKLAQIISDAPRVNIHVHPEWVQIRAAIVVALEAHPEAKTAVLRAIEGVGNGSSS